MTLLLRSACVRFPDGISKKNTQVDQTMQTITGMPSANNAAALSGASYSTWRARQSARDSMPMDVQASMTSAHVMPHACSRCKFITRDRGTLLAEVSK